MHTLSWSVLIVTGWEGGTHLDFCRFVATEGETCSAEFQTHWAIGADHRDLRAPGQTEVEKPLANAAPPRNLDHADGFAGKAGTERA